MPNNKIRSEVIGIHIQDMGGVLYPGDTNSSTGQLIIDMLKEKHPDLHTADLSNPACNSFDDYKDYIEVLLL